MTFVVRNFPGHKQEFLKPCFINLWFLFLFLRHYIEIMLCWSWKEEEDMKKNVCDFPLLTLQFSFCVFHMEKKLFFFNILDYWFWQVWSKITIIYKEVIKKWKKKVILKTHFFLKILSRLVSNLFSSIYYQNTGA